jgi:lipopolysaccharide biosynthesis glycosyltransferase
MKGLPTSTWVSPAGNVRLLLPNLLPDHIHRVLYLDSDVLVLSDITELWNSFDTNYAAAAAPDTPACPYVGRSKIAEVITSYGLLKSDPYFNSGVLFMNLKMWRQEGIGKQVLDLIARVGHQFTYVDQTALNIVLHAKWQVLDPAWNVTSSNFFETEAHVNTLLKKARILHYTYENPGTKHCHHPAEDLFLAAVRESGYFSPVEYARWRFNTLRKRTGYKIDKKLQTLREQVAVRTRMKHAFSTLLGRTND